MLTLSLEFLLMTTSTLLASWFVVINRACADCCDSLLATTSPQPMIWPRKRLSALTNISVASAEKPVSRHGYIESLTIAFARMLDAGRNWSELMKGNGKKNWTRKRSMPA